MGGGYYDRDVGEAASTTTYSATAAAVVGVVKALSPDLDPKLYSVNPLSSVVKNPIVFALDVTGSMGDWTKIIYDKMPMFYGQIMMQNYLEEPAISFCAIGDCSCDEAPLQVSPFGQGRELDGYLSKMYLEGGGGGSYYESYEFAAYFYLNHCDLNDAELPFLFVTGDEAFYEKLKPQHINKFLGVSVKEATISGRDVWKELLKKFNVFILKKDYEEPKKEAIIQKQWQETLGEERVLDIIDPKACVDIMLGAISVTSRTRTLDEYVQDMKARGQTNDRVAQVRKALKKYNDKFEAFLKKVESGEPETTENVGGNVGNEPDAEIITDADIIEARNAAEEKHASTFDGLKKTMKQNLKEIKEKLGKGVPADLICPITSEIFIEPVMTCDGHTYERAAIEFWLSKHNVSPKTKEPLANKALIQNFIVKQLLKKFYDDNVKNI